MAEELATVLAGGSSFEFKALFAIVHANLKARNAAGGGEEMLRLRAYEKLQSLVHSGLVKKVEKEYRGVAKQLKAFLAASASLSEASAAPVATPAKKAATPKPRKTSLRVAGVH